MLLASYMGGRTGVHAVVARLIQLRLRGLYSHSELVFEPGDPVGYLMPDATCQPDGQGALWCASSAMDDVMPASSVRRAGKTGGVRFKRLVLDPAKWVMVPVHRDAVAAAKWFVAHEGQRYDWQLILGFLSWIIPQKAARWTCSESCAAALGYKDSWRFDPCSLHYAQLAALM